MQLLFLLLSGVFSLCIPFLAHGASPGDVIVNEMAWMGTKAGSADEWVELKNTTNAEIDLSGWGLYTAGGDIRVISLTKKILANGYYLIERTDDSAVADVPADEIGPFGGGGISNAGEYFVLKDNAGNIIDRLDFSSGWSAGCATIEKTMTLIECKTGDAYRTMERDSSGWHTNDGTVRNGTDAKGNPIQGTPRAQNSVRSAATGTTVAESGASPAPFFPPPIVSGSSASPAVSQNIISADAGNNVVALAGDEVSFDGAKSSGSGPLSFSWNMGDGNVREGKTIAHRYQFPGRYAVILMVSDGTGASSQDRIEAAIYAKGVMISEFLPAASSGETQWVELYNANHSFIDVSGWRIVADQGDEAFSIPQNTFITGGGFLVFSAQTMKMRFPSSGRLLLSYPTGQTAHEVLYESARAGSAVARTDDGRFAWTESPTPGSRNAFVSFQEIKENSSAPAAVSAHALSLPEKFKAARYIPSRGKAESEKDEIIIAAAAEKDDVLPSSSPAPAAALAVRAFPWNTYLFILAAMSIFFTGLKYAKSRGRQDNENE